MNCGFNTLVFPLGALTDISESFTLKSHNPVLVSLGIKTVELIGNSFCFQAAEIH